MSWGGPEDVSFSTSLASYLEEIEIFMKNHRYPAVDSIWKMLPSKYDKKEKLLILLRDGRKLLGIFRSFDQFANVVLEGACERIIVGELFCDIPLGLYVIRGENVVLMIGELGLEREELPAHMARVSAPEIRMAQRAERDASDLKGTMRKRMEFLDMD